MITFSNWTIRSSGEVLARQYDHLSRTLLVSGVPEGYDWRMLVRAGGSGEYFDIIALFPMESGVGAVLTRDQLSVGGDYEMQLQGTLKADGVTVCHSNILRVNIPESMTGDAKWPTIPSEFTQIEQRVQEQADLAEESSNTAVSAMNTAVKASNAAASAKETAVKAQLNAATSESMAKAYAESAGEASAEAFNSKTVASQAAETATEESTLASAAASNAYDAAARAKDSASEAAESEANAKASAEAAAASAAQAAESTGTDGKTFVATYGVTTTDEIYTAYQAGKAVFCDYNGMLASLYTIERTDEAVFLYHTDAGTYSIAADPSGWSYEYRPAVDTTLTKSGRAADAAVVGERLSSLSDEIADKAANVYIGPVQPTDGTLYWLDTSESGGTEETVSYAVTASLTNVTIDNTAESVNEGASFAAALTADEGYDLSSVTVTMGGEDITASSYASGNIYIASVTGDIVITAVAVEVSEGSTTYTITNNLLNATSDNSAVSIKENAAYAATLTAATDYALDAVTVTMGGVDITADVYADGVISITAVTGDIVITATAISAPNEPVYVLPEPYTGEGIELEYNIVDEEKAFSFAIDFSGSATGGYIFCAGSGNSSLGIRCHANYFWFAQSQYYETVEIAYNTVTNMKAVLTHEKDSGRLFAHYIKDGTKTTAELGVNYTWNTGDGCATKINGSIATINELKIWGRVLDESEINAYLGVE